MIENERHPSWVSFVTIFLPVSSSSPFFDKLNGRKLYACGRFSYSSSFNTARNASVGTFTDPRLRIRFLPSFCFSSSFFFRVTSPP